METPTRHTLMQTGVATTATRQRTAHRTWLCRAVTDGKPPVEMAVGARPLVIGADRRCDLVLDDSQVSRRHAELQVTPEGVRVRDLGSTNGTWWQGSRIADAVVPTGASVRIGNTAIRVMPGEAPTLPPSERSRFGGLVGRSLAMRELFAVLELAAPTDATVLVEGESGTGKELVARALHDHSARARVPLVVVDCSALTDTLLDSHLFGHVRGAFTGAAADRKGAFVEADGGTVFLDEIGELPLATQSKLLRVLEERVVVRLGSTRPRPID
ncbi:MAG TPA: sigma-54-dependent Fis family transcriptional regulator, partial [Kofleriaceae bacterium]|nr:sigma-54-dependent Fis family transcriptional regulator [Kofleriaceae bacterium]